MPANRVKLTFEQRATANAIYADMAESDGDGLEGYAFELVYLRARCEAAEALLWLARPWLAESATGREYAEGVSVICVQCGGKDDDHAADCFVPRIDAWLAEAKEDTFAKTD